MAKARQPSIQEIRQQRQHRMFVGREGELTNFQQNLGLSLHDNRRRFIVNISGQGGIGKSTLLQQMIQLAAGAGYATALANQNGHDVPSVMAVIAERLADHNVHLQRFGERYRVYRQRRMEIEADPDTPSGWAASVGELIAKGGLAIGRQVPIAGGVVELVNQDAVAKQAGEWATFLARKIGNKDEVSLVSDPISTLTPLFVADLWPIVESRPVALFFDAYEYTAHYLDQWFRDLLDGRYGALPASVLFVIAGQYPLDDNLWTPYRDMVASVPLDPFTDDEAVEYLRKRDVTEPSVIEVIIRLSGRLPLLVATLAAESPTDPSEVGDPSGTAVERFLAWVTDVGRRNAAVALSLPRSFNRDITSWLIEENPSETFDWLKSMPFIDARAEGWVYHPVVRAQMVRYRRRESPESWLQLHVRLAEEYEQRISGMNLPSEDHTRNASYKADRLEATYHRLCQAPDRYLAPALNGFAESLSFGRTSSRDWAEMICQAGSDANSAQLATWGSRLTEMIAAEGEERFDSAINVLTSLLGTNLLDPQWRAVVLARLARIQLQAGSPAEALINAERALSFRSDDGRHWSVYGRALLELERDIDAVEALNKSIALDPFNRSAMLARSLAYIRMDRFQDAINDINRLISASPNDADLYRFRVLAYLLSQSLPLALADIDQIRSLSSSDDSIVFQMIESLRMFGHYAAALAQIQKEIDRLGPNLDLRLERARNRFALDQTIECIDDLNGIISTDPLNESAISLRGSAEYRSGNYTSAWNDYKVLVERRNPDYYQLSLVMCAFCAHRLNESSVLAEYATAILSDVDTETEEKVYARVFAHNVLQHDHELMTHELDQGLVKFPDSIDLQKNLAINLINSRRYEEAMSELDRLVEIAPEDVDILLCHGLASKELGHFAESIDSFERAIAIDGNIDQNFRNNYGLVLTYVGRYQDGLREFSLIDNEGYVHKYNAAIAAIRSGIDSRPFIEAARNELRLALEADSDRGSALYGLAGIGAATGLVDEALAQLEEAVSITDEARSWARDDVAWRDLRDDQRFREIIA